MNKKTFALALSSFLATLVWLGVNIYWDLTDRWDPFSTVIALSLVVIFAGMAYHEGHKKKRRHLDEVNRNQIP